MAIPNIPLNLSTMPMTTIADSLRKVKKEQLADRLSAATVGEKEATTQKTQMLSNIINQYLGGGNQGMRGGGGNQGMRGNGMPGGGGNQGMRGNGMPGGGGNQGMRGDGMPGSGGGSEMGNALVRRLMGLPTELPSEQQAREVETFRNKEELKREIEQASGENLTPTTKSNFQDISFAYDKLIPGIKELIRLTPGKFDQKGRAAWNRQKNLITDMFMTAQKLGANVPTLKTVKNILDRGYAEGTGSYKKDLQRLIKDLSDQNEHVKRMLKSGKVLPYGVEDDNEMVGKALQQNRTRQRNPNELNAEDLLYLSDEELARLEAQMKGQQ